MNEDNTHDGSFGTSGDNDHVVRSGNWHGNDTAWRMCLDLNKIVLYGRPDGTFRAADRAGRKTYLSFIDGVVGGQGNGPMDPDPLPAGAILFGADPGSVDAAVESSANCGRCSCHQLSARSAVHEGDSGTSPSWRHNSTADEGRLSGDFSRQDMTISSRRPGMARPDVCEGG